MVFTRDGRTLYFRSGRGIYAAPVGGGGGARGGRGCRGTAGRGGRGGAAPAAERGAGGLAAPRRAR